MALPYALLVPGRTGSGPAHWQNWLAGQLARLGGGADVLRFTDPDKPALDVWLLELREQVGALPTDVERVVLAHAAGSALWLHHAARPLPAALRVDRVLLVATPQPNWHEPDIVDFAPVPLDAAGLNRAAHQTRMVTGEGDPYCTVEQAESMADRLGVDLDIVPGGRGLDVAAGYGHWPAALDWTLHPRECQTPF